MRVIQEGSSPQLKKMIAACKRCSTVVEFTREESKCNSSYQGTDYSVECPQKDCASRIIYGISGFTEEFMVEQKLIEEKFANHENESQEEK